MTTFLFLIFLFTSGGDSWLDDHKNNTKQAEHQINDSSDVHTTDTTYLYTAWYYVVDSPTNFKRQLDKSDETYFLDPKPIVVAKNITSFEIYESSHVSVPKIRTV